ncbi:MAG: cell division protein ZapD [Burkholderiales bacterium]
MADPASLLAFELPLNDHIRTFLRLEFLFAQAAHHKTDVSAWGRRQHIAALLDVLQLLSRSDVRTEVCKVLSEHSAKLERLRDKPGVDMQRLPTFLEALKSLSEALLPLQAQFAGNVLRDNEFLTGIVNRSAVPGGTVGFDLPTYHLWLHLPTALQEAHLANWSKHLDLFKQGIAYALMLIRQSATPTAELAQAGSYSRQLHHSSQMLRVLLPVDSYIYPEISAGKHRCNIRFLRQDKDSQRGMQIQEDVNFQLVCCML